MVSRKPRQLLIHIIGSALFLSLPVIFSPDVSEFFQMLRIPPFQRDFLSFVLLLLFFYVHFYWLLPKFFFRRKFFWYGLSLVIALVVITYLPHVIIPHEGFRGGPDGNDFDHHERRRNIELLFFFREHFFQFLVVIVFSFFIKLNQRLKLAEKERLDAEVSYLKAQINPHFLFNTLNGIYSTAVSEGATGTANAVVQLSEMMRYVTTETEQDFVSLNKELTYIASYIEMQKIRLGNTVEIDYSFKGDSAGKRISPLILIPFVENAFKYGVNPDMKSRILISINIVGHELTLDRKSTRLNSSHRT